MGGKRDRVAREAKAASSPVNVLMDCQAKEILSADLRKLAREKGIGRTPCAWGEIWVSSVRVRPHVYKYKAEIVDPETREVLFLIRESIHPTMMDIAISMALRLGELHGSQINPQEGAVP
jgi:hypothetical protein